MAPPPPRTEIIVEFQSCGIWVHHVKLINFTYIGLFHSDFIAVHAPLWMSRKEYQIYFNPWTQFIMAIIPRPLDSHILICYSPVASEAPLGHRKWYFHPSNFLSPFPS